MTEQHKITLLQHRKNLLENPDRYIKDKDRAVKQFAETAYRSYPNLGKKKKEIIKLLKQLGNLVFDAQGNEPLYEYQDNLPRAWNSPCNFRLNYIKWGNWPSYFCTSGREKLSRKFIFPIYQM